MVEVTEQDADDSTKWRRKSDVATPDGSSRKKMK